MMFCSVVQVSGRFLSELTPFIVGPRHCGQLSAKYNYENDGTTKLVYSLALST